MPIQAIDVLFGRQRRQQGLRTGIVVGIVVGLHRDLQQDFVMLRARPLRQLFRDPIRRG